MGDLFDNQAEPSISETIAEGAVLLRGWAMKQETEVLAAIESVVAAAPFRHMVTPGGFTMSVAMTNCGAAGWVTDRSGYRYDRIDPHTGLAWPSMPEPFLALASGAAAAAGYAGFVPDACLINRYEPGARLSPHQDRNERDLHAPIVSVSLGLPAVFQFGGPRRADRMARYTLRHGDTVVWGGASRLFHHGVAPLREGVHPRLGRTRINLTFRRAL
jgi:DNA oxidative demethylase